MQVIRYFERNIKLRVDARLLLTPRENNEQQLVRISFDGFDSIPCGGGKSTPLSPPRGDVAGDKEVA